MSKKLKDLIEKGGGFTDFPWPENMCDFQMRIARDGTWYHEGDPIDRLKLCQLFATLLQRDEKGNYWLVTPGEKGKVDVEDAPFTAVEMKVSQSGAGQRLEFRTNLDHWVTADETHPIRLQIKDETGEPSPYIMIRDGLEALIGRAVFYDLINLADTEMVAGRETLYITSDRVKFKLGEVD